MHTMHTMHIANNIILEFHDLCEKLLSIIQVSDKNTDYMKFNAKKFVIIVTGQLI